MARGVHVMAVLPACAHKRSGLRAVQHTAAMQDQAVTGAVHDSRAVQRCKHAHCDTQSPRQSKTYGTGHTRQNTRERTNEKERHMQAKGDQGWRSMHGTSQVLCSTLKAHN